jgi:phosphoribosylformylglycinamidine synthase
LDGVRRGVEHGGNKSGIPTVNGALVFDDRFLGKPLVFCGTGGIMPRKSAGQLCQTKEIIPGDLICMVGGRIGKDGIHGATFSSLALDEASPTSAVQLGDPLTQKRMADFLLEARDLGLFRAITDNGAGGLSSSVGEMARLCGGARIDVAQAKTKYPGLKPFELVVSESQERMTLAVSPEKLSDFLALAERRSVEVSVLGDFRNSGRFEIAYDGKIVANLDLEFLHQGVPRLELQGEWVGRAKKSEEVSGTIEMAQESFLSLAGQALLGLLSRPNIASKEWLIRQYDHEVQGMSVIKPLHTAYSGTPNSCSGPNDAGVLRPKATSDLGLAIGCGINPKLSDVDPYLMAQSAVDEAVRNVLCVGAEYGRQDSVLALVDNFCWPDPVDDRLKTAWLVRACFGLKEAALQLSTPLVSGKDSMKNDFRGKKGGEPISISVPPTLLMTAVGRVLDIKTACTSDFKSVGDVIYLLGLSDFGLLGSEMQSVSSELTSDPIRLGCWKAPNPNWEIARRIYSWLGGTNGKLRSRLKSVHDVSEGGVLVALAESLIAKGLGATVHIPSDKSPWEFAFGEGFHSFVVSLSQEDVASVESEWSSFGVPFVRLGKVESQDRLEVFMDGGSKTHPALSVGIKQIRSAWQKEGYWE